MAMVSSEVPDVREQTDLVEQCNEILLSQENMFD
jgi:hypothetical protein